MKYTICVFYILLASCVELDYCDDKKRWFKEHEKGNAYRGVIEQKLYDQDYRGEPILILDDRSEHRIWNADIFDVIQPGDYIIKDKDSAKYILIAVETKDTSIFYWQCKGLDIK